MGWRDYAVAMAAYNGWMNERIYACCAALSDEERRRDRGAFFGSIHGTLNHILLGDQAWMQRFAGEPVTMRNPREELHAAFNALWAARRAMDERIAAWAAGLSDRVAERAFRFFSVTYGVHRELPTWAAVVHLFNHQTHHRGQLTTLLSQLGIDPGVTDFPSMPCFDAREASG
jgi:uncharacterized damage-inducible protein DinB